RRSVERPFGRQAGLQVPGLPVNAVVPLPFAIWVKVAGSMPWPYDSFHVYEPFLAETVPWIATLPATFAYQSGDRMFATGGIRFACVICTARYASTRPQPVY